MGLTLALPGVGVEGFLTHYSISEGGNFMQSISGEATNTTTNAVIGSYTHSSSSNANGYTIGIGPKVFGSNFGFSQTTSKSAVISTSGIYDFNGKKKN